MDPEFIRRADRWLGVPACALLTLVRKAAAKTAAPSRAVRKILFIKMTEQGATLLAYRAIEEAIARVGQENVYFWTFEENREIVDLTGLIPPSNVFCTRSGHALTFAADLLRTIARIRRAGIDATVDLEQFTRAPAILAWLTGATRRAGLHRFTSEGPYRGDLLTHRVQYNAYVHTSQMYYLITRALFDDSGAVPLLKVPVPEALGGTVPRFVPTAEESARVRAVLEKEAGRPVSSPLILLNPNASDLLPLRKWAGDRFAALARAILERHPEVTVAFTGSPSERAAAEAIRQAVGSERAINVAGRTSLRDLFVLYTLADVLVTNDSGPAHFASMTDVHIVTLFGPETPHLYGPLGPNARVVWANLACSPCVSAFNHRFSPCTNNVCMQAITVEQVYGVVRECLKVRGGSAALPSS